MSPRAASGSRTGGRVGEYGVPPMLGRWFVGHVQHGITAGSMRRVAPTPLGVEPADQKIDPSACAESAWYRCAGQCALTGRCGRRHMKVTATKACGQ